MIGVFPMWLWVTVLSALLFVGFVALAIWLIDRGEELTEYDQETVEHLDEWLLAKFLGEHPRWLITAIRRQLAALGALMAAAERATPAQWLHHELPVSPAVEDPPHVPAGDAPGPVQGAPPGPGARTEDVPGPAKADEEGAPPRHTPVRRPGDPWETRSCQPTAPTHDAWGDDVSDAVETSHKLDYDDDSDFRDWLRDSFVGGIPAVKP